AVDGFEPVVKPIAAEPELSAELDAWTRSRADFLRNQAAGDPETLKQRWQRHYYKGESVAGGAPAESHIARRRLRPPRPALEGE
ncbi:MAG: DUF6065 family protein, partial [Paracoccaceae bacterium]